MKCRDRFSPSPETGLDNFEPSLTKQSFTDEADINNIIARHGGVPPNPTPELAIYGDFSTVDEYQHSLNKVIQAQTTFDNLPANVRSRFANNPANLMEFLHDPNNLNEAIQLGLANSKPTANTAKTEAPLPSTT